MARHLNLHRNSTTERVYTICCDVCIQWSAQFLCTECEFLVLCSTYNPPNPALMSHRQTPGRLQHTYSGCGWISECRSLCLLSSASKLKHLFPRQRQCGRHFGWRTKKKPLSSRTANPSHKCRTSQSRTGVCVSVCACSCTLQCHWQTKHWECSTGMTSSV